MSVIDAMTDLRNAHKWLEAEARAALAKHQTSDKGGREDE